MSVSANSTQPSTEGRFGENGFECAEILPAINDAHGGVIVEMKKPMNPDTFVTLLRSSLLQWKHHGKEGVWIKLPIELVNLVETAVKEGFWFHHAEPSYLMLVYWIPKTGNTIPPNASHRVSVGAIVLNDNKEGEDIFNAAIREVKEETGIDTEFVEVLAFRQEHKTFFGKSDLFFLCVLRPLSFDIKKQDLEIEAAQWMPFEEFAAQPFNQKHEPFQYINELCSSAVRSSYAGFSPRPISSYFKEQLSFLYFNSNDLHKSS
ncbi:nudix hydrolase 10-like isoform X2 [Prosopis cineraria]|uniref:nudix hydrolase 10-like isoform X2 n=1 Tax=Prosopis cineraria TaxID=364024 RepID=UPI0024102E55|nr:nudix hydrolase 10-like isoform X2 [Prosopis cineraria]